MSRRHALVTGGARRVGRAIALRLAQAGFDIAIHHRGSDDEAQSAAAEVRALGQAAEVFQADLAETDGPQTLVDQVLTTFGGLDVLVSSAGNFERVGVEDVTEAQLSRALDLNLSAAFFLVQRARQALVDSRGSVVFVTCSSATTPFRNYLPYVVSKGALRHLMKTLALELAPHVRVNAVAPGTVLPPAEMSDAQVGRLAASIPLRRNGTAEDVADAVAFLVNSPFITGEELCVDGGRNLARVEAF